MRKIIISINTKYTCARTHTHTYTYTPTSTLLCTRIHMHTSTSTHAHAHTHTHAHAHTHTHTHTQTHKHHSLSTHILWYPIHISSSLLFYCDIRQRVQRRSFEEVFALKKQISEERCFSSFVWPILYRYKYSFSILLPK